MQQQVQLSSREQKAAVQMFIQTQGHPPNNEDDRRKAFEAYLKKHLTPRR